MIIGRTSIMFSLAWCVISGCSHPKMIIGEYKCYIKNKAPIYLKLNPDSTFTHFQMLVLCGDPIHILPNSGHWHTHSDSIFLMYNAREESEELITVPQVTWFIDSNGLAMAKGDWAEECISFPRDSFKSEVVFYNHHGIYDAKTGRHYRNKYSKATLTH